MVHKTQQKGWHSQGLWQKPGEMQECLHKSPRPGAPSEWGRLLWELLSCLARGGTDIPEPLGGPGPQLQLEGVELQALPQAVQLQGWLLHSPHRCLLGPWAPPGGPSPQGGDTEATEGHQQHQAGHQGCPHQHVSVAEEGADPCKRKATGSSQCPLCSQSAPHLLWEVQHGPCHPPGTLTPASRPEHISQTYIPGKHLDQEPRAAQGWCYPRRTLTEQSHCQSHVQLYRD